MNASKNKKSNKSNPPKKPKNKRKRKTKNKLKDKKLIKAKKIKMPLYKPTKKRILVLSGGGVRGINHIGVLKSLEDNNILKGITTFAGTSAGGLISALHLIGYSPDELFHFIINFNLKLVVNLNIYNALFSFGLDNGQKFEFIIKKLIENKLNISDVTLLELFNKTHKKLILTTTNLNTSRIVYLSHITHPNLSLVTAIRMTTAVPFFFAPVMYQNCHYNDGACIDNYPIHIFKDNLKQVIGSYLIEETNELKTISNVEEYIFQLFQSLKRGMDKNSFKGYEDYTIIIKDKINVLNFNLTKETKINMFKISQKIANQFINS